jgi:hypothetical protein
MLCKIWGFQGSDYEECRLLGFKHPVRTSQETHYVSATQSSQLMLCKMWRFHGSDYEECRLLGYKNPVRTSQETHYVSTTGLSRPMPWKIWGCRGGDYGECRLLRCYAVYLVRADVSEKRIASIFRVIGLRIFLARRGDMPHDGWGRDPRFVPRQETYLAQTHIHKTEATGNDAHQNALATWKVLKLSTRNKILIYKATLKPIWTYAIQLWGTASTSNRNPRTLPI